MQAVVSSKRSLSLSLMRSHEDLNSPLDVDSSSKLTGLSSLMLIPEPFFLSSNSFNHRTSANNLPQRDQR